MISWSIEQKCFMCRYIMKPRPSRPFKQGTKVCTSNKPAQRGGAVPFPALGRVEMACRFPEGLILGRFSLE